MIYLPYQYIWRSDHAYPIGSSEYLNPFTSRSKTHFRQGILSGSLAPDTRLPASRQLARDLGVNRITVENAYSELEADGLVFSRVGSGTYVLPPNPLPSGSQEQCRGFLAFWQQSLPAR